MDLTVVINTYNEEKNIEEAIGSCRLLTDKIIVVDMESTDNTVGLAKKHGAKICFFPFSSYVEPARAFAISSATTDWLFLLDADERMTPELAEEIQKLITNHQSLITHYQIPRKNIFARSKWLKYGGWWPDYQIRLINKEYFSSWPKRIHSAPVIKGKIGETKNAIVHLFHNDLESMVKKTLIFENIESDLLYKAKKFVSVSVFFRKFLAEGYRRTIKNLGILDGPIGIIESIYQAFSKTITYLFLYEKTHEKK